MSPKYFHILYHSLLLALDLVPLMCLIFWPACAAVSRACLFTSVGLFTCQGGVALPCGLHVLSLLTGLIIMGWTLWMNIFFVMVKSDTENNETFAQPRSGANH